MHVSAEPVQLGYDHCALAAACLGQGRSELWAAVESVSPYNWQIYGQRCAGDPPFQRPSPETPTTMSGDILCRR